MRRKQREHHDLYRENKQEAGTHIYPLDAITSKTGAALLIPLLKHHGVVVQGDGLMPGCLTEQTYLPPPHPKRACQSTGPFFVAKTILFHRLLSK